MPFDEAQAHIMEKFKHQFNDSELLAEAMCNVGYLVTSREAPNGNQNLAFVGRKALDLVLSANAYNQGIVKSDSTKSTAATLSQANLSLVGKAQGLHHLYAMHVRYPDVSHRLMAAAVEATFGAVFVDSGMDLVVVRRGMEAFGLI